jgi:hypothetical protein
MARSHSRRAARACPVVTGLTQRDTWVVSVHGAGVGAGVPGVAKAGAREPVWIGPARRHAPKRAGGGPRILFGRLGHIAGLSSVALARGASDAHPL